MFRVSRLIERTGRIRESRFDVNMFFQNVTPGMQSPPIDHAIVGGYFDSVSVAFKIVLEVDRVGINISGSGWRVGPAA